MEEMKVTEPMRTEEAIDRMGAAIVSLQQEAMKANQTETNPLRFIENKTIVDVTNHLAEICMNLKNEMIERFEFGDKAPEEEVSND